MGSVHNPISFDEYYQHAYNYCTEEMCVGLFYNNEKMLHPDDAFIAHFKYGRDLYSFYDKCRNFKFTDALAIHVKNNYTLDAFARIINTASEEFVCDDLVYDLFTASRMDKIIKKYLH